MAISFKSIYKDLLKKNINVDRLIDWQADCLDYTRKVENNDKINIKPPSTISIKPTFLTYNRKFKKTTS